MLNTIDNGVLGGNTSKNSYSDIKYNTSDVDNHVPSENVIYNV